MNNLAVYYQRVMNNKIFTKLIKIFPWIFFALFTYLISRKLLGGVVSTGDFPYYWPFSSVNSFSIWDTAYLGYSRASIMFGLQIWSLIPVVFSKIGFSNESISYFLNYGPVYLCSLVYYFVARKISKNVLLAYFAGLFIILNNLILEHFLVWPGYIFFSLIVYGITISICYDIYLHGLNFKRIFLIVLLSFFNLHPFFFFINLLFLFIFSVYYSVTHLKLYSKKQLFSYFMILLLGIIVVQAYWLVPFVKNIFISSSSQVYSGNQLSVFSGYLQSVTYVNLFNLYSWPGLLGEKMHGGILQSLFYFYLLSLVVFFFIRNKTPKTNWITFLFLSLLIFFGLALGPVSQLTGGIWMYLYRNLSLFGFFRSFSRFIVIYLPIFIFLFIFLFKDWKNRYKNYILLLTILLLLAANTIFLTGNLGGFITSAKVPQDYISVNEKYFQGDQSQYNILSLPNIPYEAYTWDLANQKTETGETINQSEYFRELFFSKPVVYNRYAVNLDIRNDFFKSFFKYDADFTSSDNFNQAVDELNVKYILVQKDLIDVMKDNAQVPVEKYLDYLNEDKDLILIEDNNNFALYENENYLPIISMPDIQFTKVNDTEYIISIKNLSNKEPLSFLQSYDAQWQLYLRPSSDNEECKPINYYENVQTTECQPAEKTIDWKTLSYLYQKPIFDNTHQLVDGYANGWTIDPNYIKQNFDPSYYKVNPDGSIDVELTLYFQPQSYFDLGLIVSGATLVACLGYLGWDVARRRKKKMAVDATINEKHI